MCVVCSLLLSMCYKLLENPGFVREKTARDKVFGLMGSLMKRFNMALGEITPHHSETLVRNNGEIKD